MEYKGELYGFSAVKVKLMDTVFDLISELFVYVILVPKNAQFSEPPCTLNDVPR